MLFCLWGKITKKLALYYIYEQFQRYDEMYDYYSITLTLNLIMKSQVLIWINSLLFRDELVCPATVNRCPLSWRLSIIILTYILIVETASDRRLCFQCRNNLRILGTKQVDPSSVTNDRKSDSLSVTGRSLGSDLCAVAINISIWNRHVCPFDWISYKTCKRPTRSRQLEFN